MTDKEQIKTYIDIETKRKFEIIRVLKNKKSISKYTEELIINCIKEYESQYGEIILPEENKCSGG